jgi:hypothetical protein
MIYDRLQVVGEESGIRSAGVVVTAVGDVMFDAGSADVVCDDGCKA